MSQSPPKGPFEDALLGSREDGESPLDDADVATNLDAARRPSSPPSSDPPLALVDGTLEARPSAAVSADAAALRRARANLVRGIAEDARPAPKPAPVANPHSNALVNAIQAMRIISIGDSDASAHRPSTAPAYAAPREEPALALVEPLDELDELDALDGFDAGEPIEPTPIMPLVAEVVVTARQSARPLRPASVPPVAWRAPEPAAAEPVLEESEPVEVPTLVLEARAPSILPPAPTPELSDPGSLDVDLDADEAIEPTEDRISEIPPEVDPDDLELSDPEPDMPSRSAASVPAHTAAAAPKIVSVPPGPSPRLQSQPSIALSPAAGAAGSPLVSPLGTPSGRPVQPLAPGPALTSATQPIAPVAAAAAAPALAEPSSLIEPPTKPRTKAWWEVVFSDDFQRSVSQLTDHQLATEVSFIEESLGVERGGVVLDLACGTGRHAVELALRGYSVVGYDLSVAMLARASDEAQERNARLNFLQGDMREMGFEDMFDGVYSWCTSFGFFDEEKNIQVVQRIHRALRKGGMFLLDVLNRDFVTARQPSLVWFEGDSCICMDETRMDYITSRLRVKRTVMLEDGRTREIEYSMRLYSLHELGRVLHDAGFKVTEVSGHPAMPGVYFGADSPRLIVLAEKA